MPDNDLFDNDYAEYRLRIRRQEAEMNASTLLYAPEGYGYGEIDPKAPGKYGGDIAKSVPHGIAQAVTNASDSIAALAATLDLQGGTAEDPTGFDPEKKKEYEAGSLTNPLEGIAPETLPGKLTGGMAQFLTGFLPFLKMFRALGAAGYIGELGAGMAADLTVFEPFQDNLANLVDQLPTEIKNPVLAYLAEPVRAVGEALKIEQDDTQVEARLKRMAEGLMMASFVDPFIKALRVIKQAGAGPAVAKKVGKEAVEQTGISFIEHGAKAHEIHVGMGGATYNVRTGENMAGQDALVMSIYEGRQVKVPGQPTSDQIAGYIEMNKDLLLGPDARVNLGTWFDPDEGATFLDVVATIPREHIEAAHGLGKEFDQKAAYDLATGQDIPMKGTGQGIPSQIPEAERLSMVPTETTGTMKLQRYQDQPGLTELDPELKKSYTGVSAGERNRLEGVLGEETVGAPRRLNYYTEGAIHEPQVVQGRTLYETTIPKGRIYNGLMDPLGLRAKATPEGMVQPDANTFERLIKEAGYAGYVDPNRGVAAVWEKLPATEVKQKLPLMEAARAILKSEEGFIDLGEGLAKGMKKKHALEGAAQLALGKRPFNKWLKNSTEALGEKVAMVQKGAAEKAFSEMLNTTPKWLTRTKRLKEYWETGKHLLDWYNEVPGEIQMIFGDDAAMFTKFLAATSPRATSKANITMGLKAYRQWVVGGRTGEMTFVGFTGAHKKNLARAARGDEMVGRKVINFEKALLGDPEAVTVDRWMQRAYRMKGGE
ncbi:MAG: hypothetical protein ACYTFW_22485, partial [Planctomycetota bacterium]